MISNNNYNYNFNNLSISNANKIINYYKLKRETNPFYTFSVSECIDIMNSYELLGQKINYDHDLIKFSPINIFMDKPIADEISISLWNEIMPLNFKALDLVHLKKQAVSFIEHMDRLKPNGKGFTEEDTIQYVTANSSSTFLGIQQASKSKFALDSMINTIESHSTKTTISRPWLIPNLQELHNYLIINKDIMNKNYAELLIHAKNSSASIPNNKINYRSFLFQNTLDDILKESIRYTDNKIPYIMTAAVRNSNRAKYRLIFTMPAQFRAIDFLINNGSYDLCTNNGIYSQYTTEGINNSNLWDQLSIMTDRSDVNMLCVDFKGYDTQISILDYLKISSLLNKHRLNDPYFNNMFSWYYNWLLQPKPIATKVTLGSDIKYHWVLDYQNKLASGLHGTHSFENLYGIATYKEMINQGINIKRCWFNGDDQNFLVRKGDTESAINWLSSQFNISWEKSLIGHELSVWSKLWFSRDQHPVWEVGTIRSIFEREGGEVELVEQSKFKSNYCKILQVAIILIRLGKRPEVIQHWIDRLCQLTDPVIDSSRIPMSLESINTIQRSTIFKLPKPRGLNSVKSYLTNKHLPTKLLNSSDMYNVMLNMYNNNNIYSMEAKEILYCPEKHTLQIDRALDYSEDQVKEIPWMYNNLKSKTKFSTNQLFVRSVLQGTKSYDGAIDVQYSFHNMITLAKAINDRNRSVWRSKI